ncbi:unnamed protein product [Somion occarium]|uniref:DUF6533 domain-containing protein n=1 Tax=Somion occarium TaxID=3059160 RepID=A0ABP1EDV7_9APHY
MSQTIEVTWDDYESLFISTSYVMVAAVIPSYDILLTFSREVDYIWKRRFSVVTVLFILWVPRTVLEVYVSSMRSQLLIALFSAFRVWAIWGRRWLPFSLVLLVSLVVPCVNLYHYSSLITVTVTPALPPLLGGGCAWLIFISYSLPVATRIIAIVADALVLAMTWVKTASLLKQAHGVNVRPRLITMFLRDGTLYFVFLMALNVVTLIIDLAGNDNTTQFVFVNEAISTVLISRFLLDLRGVYVSEPINDTTISGGTSTIRFSPRLLGNLGAPLEQESVWMSNAAGDEGGSQDEIDSSDTLSAGLYQVEKPSDVQNTRS